MEARDLLGNDSNVQRKVMGLGVGNGIGGATNRICWGLSWWSSG